MKRHLLELWFNIIEMCEFQVCLLEIDVKNFKVREVQKKGKETLIILMLHTVQKKRNIFNSEKD